MGEVIFLKLIIAYAVTDYALQDASMIKGKNWRESNVWPYYLTAHCLIQAGGVWVVTANPWLAIAELAIHWFIDLSKCSGLIGFHIDQCLHVICRLIYAFLA